MKSVHSVSIEISSDYSGDKIAVIYGMLKQLQSRMIVTRCLMSLSGEKKHFYLVHTSCFQLFRAIFELALEFHFFFVCASSGIVNVQYRTNDFLLVTTAMILLFRQWTQ